MEEDQLSSATRLEALAGERQTEVFEAWGLEGPGRVDFDVTRFYVGVIEIVALKMPAGNALRALGEAEQGQPGLQHKMVLVCWYECVRVCV
jgi:hypothetical protein